MATEQQLANRKRLIEALRAEMPAGFKWDFATNLRHTTCGSVGCAIGLAKILGMIENPYIGSMAYALGIDRFDAKWTFAPNDDGIDILPGYGVPWEQVTPQMVADKLEAI